MGWRLQQCEYVTYFKFIKWQEIFRRYIFPLVFLFENQFASVNCTAITIWLVFILFSLNCKSVSKKSPSATPNIAHQLATNTITITASTSTKLPHNSKSYLYCVVVMAIILVALFRCQGLKVKCIGASTCSLVLSFVRSVGRRCSRCCASKAPNNSFFSLFSLLVASFVNFY